MGRSHTRCVASMTVPDYGRGSGKRVAPFHTTNSVAHQQPPMTNWRVTHIHSIQLNDAVDDYEGSLQLAVTNGERVDDLRCPFRRKSEGGIERYDEGDNSRVIWRWENPPELDEITLADSIGWELSDETAGWDVHGYVRGGEWEPV